MNNENVIMITFPLWLNIILGVVGIHLILVAILILLKNKTIDSFNKLSSEKKNKLVSSYSRYVKYLKYSLWLMPINLIFVPYILYLYLPNNAFHFFIFMVVSYVSIIASIFYRTTVLNGFKT